MNSNSSSTPEEVKKHYYPSPEISEELMSLCLEIENNPNAREKIFYITDPNLFIKIARELGFTITISELEKAPLKDETLDLCNGEDGAPFFAESLNRLLISGDYCL